MSARDTYNELVQHLRKTATLASCQSVLGWDEQTYMPPEGAEFRSRQTSLLAGMVHDLATDPRLGGWLGELAVSPLMSDPESHEAVNIREASRDFARATKLPKRLVEEQAGVATQAQQAWIEARKENRFDKFRPWLEKTVALKREEAACLAELVASKDGSPREPYDALLDQFEPGMTAADVTRLFTPLRDELVTLIRTIRESGKQPDRDLLTRIYPIPQQREFATAAAKAVGFRFTAGRLDETAHPFCSGFGPGDVRLTTRYDEHHFPGAFFGTLHEAGHGLYEQNLDPESFGLGMGTAVSLGIHESQSRLWENFVGRSDAFWKHFFPQARKAFPVALSDVTKDEFVWAINDVQPSWIRVEADEATYNLHILLRFDIERPLVKGDLAPADVPAVWNETFRRYFDMTPPSDTLGCLQDIHWSFGGIGYFPTYTLGNMNAAQLYDAAEADLGSLSAQFEQGRFEPLKTWLVENIHRRGKQYPASKLIERVTGKPLSHHALIRHLKAKYERLYA
jgi:carboxypeptidase Taq